MDFMKSLEWRVACKVSLHVVKLITRNTTLVMILSECNEAQTRTKTMSNLNLKSLLPVEKSPYLDHQGNESPEAMFSLKTKKFNISWADSWCETNGPQVVFAVSLFS